MRRLCLLALFLGSCSETTMFEPTGGFAETVLDARIQHVQGLRPADIDGDGRLDVVAALSLTDAVHVYSSVDETRDSWNATSISQGSTVVAVDVDVADLNMDGDPDVVTVGLFQRDVGIASAGDVLWYENPGAPDTAWVEHAVLRANRTAAGYEGLYGPFRIRVVDLDEDNDLDLVVGTVQTVDPNGAIVGGGLHWFPNDGTATQPRFTGPVPIDPEVAVDSLEIADLDADGSPDIVVAGGTTQRASWYRRTGNTFSRQDLTVGMRSFALATAQLDGDPELEVVLAGLDEGLVIDTATISVHRVDLDLVTGTVTSTSIITGVSNPGGSQPRMTTADFDGNGRPDIILASTGSGDIMRYTLGDDGLWTSTDVRLGYNGINTFSHADIDADGKDDLITGTFDFATRDRVSWWRNEN